MRSRASRKKILYAEFALVGILYLATDQILKYIARSSPEASAYLWKPYIGWEYFENSGIAFSIPFPNNLLILITPFVILGLSLIMTSYRCKQSLRACARQKLSPHFVFGLLLIIFGASSNLIDRILFDATIDYLRFGTAVVNVADIMIVAGVLLLLLLPGAKEKKA